MRVGSWELGGTAGLDDLFRVGDVVSCFSEETISIRNLV